jgi:gamma-glutamyltranspeptidase/glutathione hydrolase
MPTQSARRSLLVIGLLGACTRAQPVPSTLAPDVGKRVVAHNGVVASAHPLASEAGLAVLREGGNAIDAAVATAFAICVAEPEMSGVGGSGAMLVWRQREGRAEFLDFYAAQPVAAFRAAGVSAPVGGRGGGRGGRGGGGGEPAEGAGAAQLTVVGVPGLVAGLLAAHERFGKLTRAQVMAPAIRLAEEGYPMYPVLASMIARDSAGLMRDSIGRALFFRNGHVLGIGEQYANPALARVLRTIASEGRKGFYEGWVARDVVARMNGGGHPVRLEDFAAY